MATLKLVIDTRSKKANGTYPIVFRLTHQSKSTSIPTNLALLTSEWDAAKQKVKKAHSKAEVLNHELSKARMDYLEKLMEINPSLQMDVTSIKQKLVGQVESNIALDFFAYSAKEIKAMHDTNRVGNAIVYECAVNSLRGFVGKGALTFERLNYKLLVEFESYLITKGLKTNAIANYMRTIRAIFNKSIKTSNTNISHYPFKNFSIKHERTMAKVLTKESFDKLVNLELEADSPEYISRAIFLLSFNLIGISFVDLITLKRTDVVDGRIVYRRKKTKRIYSIKLNHIAQGIITQLESLNPKSPYLIPLLQNECSTALNEKLTVQLRLKTCNKYLKKIGTQLNFDLVLTTYVARYTWATTAKRCGFSNEIIAEALGHEYGNAVTSTYLDGFSHEIIDNANDTITQMMFG